jgi:hypothetical protein
VNAQNAGNAGTVGGLQVRQFFFKSGTFPIASTTQLSVDGIVIQAGCDGSGKPIATFENDSGVGAAWRIAVFGTGTTLSGQAVLDSSPHDMTQAVAPPGNGELQVARSDGKVVNVSYMFRSAPNFDGEAVCTVNGSAIAS